MPAGIYIHIPFCKRKCPYCDFYSIAADDITRCRYADSLVTRISDSADKSIVADSIYFGGGTPSLMTPEDISRIISAVKSAFTILPDCEITMECNPSSTTFEKLCGYRESGVNRLSFGVQSSNNSELTKLGRLHDFSLARQAVDNAHKAGFINISCDLMIGTPLQTADSLLRSIHDITDMGITHISCYMLKIEEGTAYDCDSVRSSVADDDTVSDMYLALVNELESLGYPQYEISNFSREGCESRHNTKYWIGEDYLGFGPSAHSYYKGKRTYCGQTVSEFIAAPLCPDEIEDSAPNPLEEYILLGLRLNRGISLAKVRSLGGNADSFINTAQKCKAAGYLTADSDRVSLTTEGFLLSNSIISSLIDAAFS